MITLYEISAEQQRLNYLLEESGGELTPEIQELLIINEGNFLSKSENYAKAILHYKAVEQTIKAEQERLDAFKKTAQKTQERLKEKLSEAMILFEKEKIEFNTIKLSFRKSQSVQIIDESKIPNEFIKVKTEIDKAGIKEALKSQSIPGAILQDNLNLQIK